MAILKNRITYVIAAGLSSALFIALPAQAQSITIDGQSVDAGVLITRIADRAEVLAQTSTSEQSIAAMTREELIALIQSMIAQLGTNSNSVSTVTNVDTPNTNQSVSIGATVETTERLRVRAAAGVSGAAVTTVAAGAAGMVLSGPVVQDNYTWWNVAYEDGITGWSAGSWLDVVSAPVLSGDGELPTITIAPASGVAPLTVDVYTRHNEVDFANIEISFTDDNWVALTPCAEYGDTVCVDAGRMSYTYSAAGTYEITLRSGALERVIDEILVIDVSGASTQESARVEYWQSQHGRATHSGVPSQHGYPTGGETRAVNSQ